MKSKTKICLLIVSAGAVVLFVGAGVSQASSDGTPELPQDQGSVSIAPLPTPNLTVHLSNRDAELLALRQEYDAKILGQMLYMVDNYDFCTIDYGISDHRAANARNSDYKAIMASFNMPELQAEFECQAAANILDTHTTFGDMPIFAANPTDYSLTAEQGAIIQAFLDDYAVFSTLYTTYQTKVHTAHQNHNETTQGIIDPPAAD